jgi:hypothetical protein
MTIAQVIQAPLWALMCAAHGCDPACGCDAEFDVSVGPVRRWIADHGREPGELALAQLEALIADPPGVARALREQCRLRFDDPEGGIAWLHQWRHAIVSALDDAE